MLLGRVAVVMALGKPLPLESHSPAALLGFCLGDRQPPHRAWAGHTHTCGRRPLRRAHRDWLTWEKAVLCPWQACSPSAHRASLSLQLRPPGASPEASSLNLNPLERTCLTLCSWPALGSVACAPRSISRLRGHTFSPGGHWGWDGNAAHRNDWSPSGHNSRAGHPGRTPPPRPGLSTEAQGGPEPGGWP